MSDLELRRLERRYRSDPTDQNLARLNSYLLRQGLIGLPTAYQEIRDLELEQGRGALPIFVAALQEYYQECEGPDPSVDTPREDLDMRNRVLRNAVHHLLGAIGRWGSIAEVPMLEEMLAWFDEHHAPYQRSQKPQFRLFVANLTNSTIQWLQIKYGYGFTDETSIWEVVETSPLIDEIIIAPNAQALNNVYYQRRFGYWQQEPGIAFYGGLYRESSGWRPTWRSSTPGYGTASSVLTVGLHTTLHAILAAKYQGRIRGIRDTLPEDQRPEEIVFCTTQQAVDLLSQEHLHYTTWPDSDRTQFTDPHRYSYLFVYPPE